MYGQIPPTELDLRFTLFGVPIRVHPVFWITSAFLAWVPNALHLVAIGVACILVAILVHELGHALVTRRFGWQPEIVLYVFGGYATTQRYSTWKDIAVSAAGPIAGFMLYFAILLPCWFSGLVDYFVFLPRTFAGTFGDFNPLIMQTWPEWIGVFQKGPKLIATDGGVMVLHAISFSLFINLVWNVMNLLPVLPLDGGQISRELWQYYQPRRGLEICLKLSIAIAAAVAAAAFIQKARQADLLGLDPLFLGLMFAFLAFGNWQQLQRMRGGSW